MVAPSQSHQEIVVGISSRRSFLWAIAGSALLPACEGTATVSNADSNNPGLTLAVDQARHPDDGCDGETINRAIEQVYAKGGGVVLLEKATYIVRRPINLSSGVTLRGKGAALTVIEQGGTTEAWARYPANAIISTPHDEIFENIHVQDLAVKGLHEKPISQEGPFFAKSGIAILNARNSSIKRCVVSDVGTGIGFFGSAGTAPHRNLIDDCLVRNASSWVEPGNPGTPRGITMATDFSTVRRCSVEASHTGYYVATEHGLYQHCSATGWRDDGFYINANYCRLENCRAIAASKRSEGLGSGFAMNPSKGNILTHCLALRCPNAGVRFRHAGKIAPTDNRLISCSFIDCGYGFLDDMTGADPYPAAVSRRNEFDRNTARDCQFCGFMFIMQCEGMVRGNRAISNNRGGVTKQNIGGISFGEYCLDNLIEDNECDDTAAAKTQTWGLYVYPQSVTMASIANTGNRIQHKSKYGIDVF